MSRPASSSRLRYLAGQRSLQIALVLWLGLSIAGVVLSRGKVPFDMPIFSAMTPLMQVMVSSVVLFVILLEISLVAVIARRRPIPDLAVRAPERSVALRETVVLWVYGLIVLFAGQYLGIHFFGEGIALHLNGSLVGATHVQSPREVFAWAAYNGVLLALLPYVVFRCRGYSRQQLNLKSANWKNDLLVILIVLVIGCGFDLAGPNIFQLTTHQQIAGGLLSFVVHLFGTDLPVMIFIYAILAPRYARLTSPATAFLLGAASYPMLHVFESWTRYDTPPHAVLSVIFVFLTFFPPGVMKSFLTVRTGNAWVHLWGFHAITPHVTVDTRLLVHDFNIS